MAITNVSPLGASRFGFRAVLPGAPGSADERRVLVASLEHVSAVLEGSALPATPGILSAMLRGRKLGKIKLAAQVAGTMGSVEPDAMAGTMMPTPSAIKMEKRTPLSDEVTGAVAHCVANPDTEYVERLVLHWADHFTVSAVKGKAGLTVGPYMREAIRPNVLTTFEQLLFAVVTHPAMLFYLDNDASLGPRSVIGLRKKQGLNENLGREVLELHTLGVDGGYTQDDVIALAKILTGWTVDLDLESDTCGETIFDPRRHEGGMKRLMGVDIPDGGREQLPAALKMLARHPSTARNVARRMTASFLSSSDAERVAGVLARSFTESGGDLKRVAATLVGQDEMWSWPARKIRPPVELVYIVSALIGQVPPSKLTGTALSAMGQPFLKAPSPKGWPTEDNAWLTSDGIKSRLDWAAEIGARYGDTFDLDRVKSGASGWVLSDETLTAVKRAESKGQALALLIMSPEIQRR